MLKKPFRKSVASDSWQKYVYMCQGCGLCINACPPGHLSPGGLHAPRSRLALMRAFLEGRITRKEAGSAFFTCLHCGQCERVCPAGLPLRELFVEFASLLKKTNNDPRYKALYLLQSSPYLAKALQPAAALVSRTRLKTKLPPLFGDLPLKAFSGPSRGKRAPNAAGSAVLLFGGCLSKNIDLDIARACVTLVINSGRPLISPVLPCCGRVNRIIGQKAESLALARKNLKLLSSLEFEYILTPCPACALELGHYWPGLKGLSRTERAWAEKIAEKVLDPTSFMRKIPSPGPFAEVRTQDSAFFHISCLSPAANIRDIKNFFPDCKTAVAEEGENCCGASLLSSMEKNHPGQLLSDRLGRKLRDQALASGADTLCTTCPACKLRLKQIMTQQGDSVAVLHIAELYAKLVGGAM